MRQSHSLAFIDFAYYGEFAGKKNPKASFGKKSLEVTEEIHKENWDLAHKQKTSKKTDDS